jgi:hypothetical protein
MSMTSITAIPPIPMPPHNTATLDDVPTIVGT